MDYRKCWIEKKNSGQTGRRKQKKKDKGDITLKIKKKGHFSNKSSSCSYFHRSEFWFISFLSCLHLEKKDNIFIRPLKVMKKVENRI